MSKAFQKVEFDQGGLKIIDDQADDDEADVKAKPLLFSEIARKNNTGIATGSYVVTSGGGGDAVKSRTVQYSTRCRLYAAGKCTFGARCHFRHDSVSNGIDSENNNNVDQGDQECGICIEMIAAKGERFGLLLGCTHAFCLRCIRDWRAVAQQEHATEQATDAVRSCPVCRAYSPFVIPSVYFVSDVDFKQELQDEFLQNTKRTKCRYWSGKNGSCQFGSSCFYQHINPDGTPGIDSTRSYVDADGIHVVPANDRRSLADFIVMPARMSSSSSSSSSATITTSVSNELPKWARDLDENDVEEVRQFVEGSNAASNPAPVSERRPVSSAMHSATRGFAELDLSGAAKPPAAAASSSNVRESGAVNDWSSEEQSKLEEALKLFPGAASDKERWQAIADHVGRSRKDCVMRFRFCASVSQGK